MPCKGYTFEVIYLAIIYEFILNSMAVCELHGQIIGLFILIVTAAETSCALAILVSYFLADFELTVAFQRIVKHQQPVKHHYASLFLVAEVSECGSECQYSLLHQTYKL
jgi:hypothetical protein